MTKINPNHWLFLKRTVRFGDTDGAGVIHFFNLFKWCHEAWEESLELYGISASEIFPGDEYHSISPITALPIVQCEANYYQPLYVGDHLDLKLIPRRLDSSSFALSIEFMKNGNKVAIGNLKHVSINVENRTRCLLPEKIDLWLEASSLNLDLKKLS